MLRSTFVKSLHFGDPQKLSCCRCRLTKLYSAPIFFPPPPPSPFPFLLFSSLFSYHCFSTSLMGVLRKGKEMKKRKRNTERKAEEKQAFQGFSLEDFSWAVVSTTTPEDGHSAEKSSTQMNSRYKSKLRNPVISNIFFCQLEETSKCSNYETYSGYNQMLMWTFSIFEVNDTPLEHHIFHELNCM